MADDAIPARPNQRPISSEKFFRELARKRPGAIPDEMRAFAKKQLHTYDKGGRLKKGPGVY